MIYFVHIRNPRTGEYYDAYNDYFRLVHLSGFQECDIEDIDPFSDNTYIVTLNYHGFDQGPIPDNYFPEGRTARMILHQLERFNLIDERFDEVWLYDRSMPELNHPKAKYVILGGHKDFMEPIECSKLWDFYHMCYLYPRRAPMILDLSRRGAFIAPAPIEWEDKNRFMQQSKAGIALHQHDHSLDLIEPLRLTVFSLFKLPILAEKSTDFHPYKAYSYEDFMAGKITMADLTDWETNWHTFTEKHTFRSEILKALGE